MNMWPELRVIDLDCQKDLESFADVARATRPSVDPAGLIGNLKNSGPGSICFGAWGDGELAAVNTFVAHDVLVASQRSTAYELAWGAAKNSTAR